MSYFNSIVQNAISDPLNSSTTNLSGSVAYSGSAVSTLGVNAIQVSFIADQKCTIYVDQSPEGTNWDISDNFAFNPSTAAGFGTTVQAINSYYRVRVLNNTTVLTTKFRLQSVLCPIVDPLPRALDPKGYLKVGVYKTVDGYGFSPEYTPAGDTRAIIPYRMIGTSFSGLILDTNFLTPTISSIATASIGSGSLILTQGSGSVLPSAVQTLRSARHLSGFSERCRMILKSDTGLSASAPFTHRWGVFTTTDGAFFERSGSNWNVVTRYNSVDTRVSASSFNYPFIDIPTFTNYKTYEIYYSNTAVHFTYDDAVVHKVTATTSPWTSNVDLPVRIEIFQPTQSLNHPATVSSSIDCRAMSVARLGPGDSQNTSFNLILATGSVLKYGPGVLKTVAINRGAVVLTASLVDAIMGTTGTSLAKIYMTVAMTPVTMTYNLPFFTGLVLSSSAISDITVVYE